MTDCGREYALNAGGDFSLIVGDRRIQVVRLDGIWRWRLGVDGCAFRGVGLQGVAVELVGPLVVVVVVPPVRPGLPGRQAAVGGSRLPSPVRGRAG